MKGKILGILICTLLIASTVLAIAESSNEIIAENYEEDNVEKNTISSGGLSPMSQGPGDAWPQFRYDRFCTGYNPYSPLPNLHQMDIFVCPYVNDTGIYSTATVLNHQHYHDIYFCEQTDNRSIRRIRFQNGMFDTNPTNLKVYPTNSDKWDWWSSPAIDMKNDRVFVGQFYGPHADYDGFLCLDLHLNDPPLLQYHIPRVQGPATIVEKSNQVIVGTSDLTPGATNNVICYSTDPLSLIPQWFYPTGDKILCTAAVDDTIHHGVQHEHVIIGSNDGFVYCLQLSTGNVIWKFDTFNNVGGYVQGSPCIDTDNGQVYVNCFDGFVYCLDLEGIRDGNDGINDPNLEPPGYFCDIIWMYDTQSPVIVASPGGYAQGRDRLFVASQNDKKMVCLNALNGLPLWEFDLALYDHTLPVDFILQSSPTLVSSYVIIAGGSPTDPNPGHIYCLDETPDDDNDGSFNEDPIDGLDNDGDNQIDEDPDKGKPEMVSGATWDVIWELKTVHGGYGRFGASPAIVDGVIYIGDYEGVMWAIGGQNLLIRDHDSDIGITPSFDVNNRNGVFDGMPVDYPYWKSPDIIVDAPPYQTGIPTNSENPKMGDVNRIWVRLNNIGHGPAENIGIKLFANSYHYGMNLPFDLGSPVFLGNLPDPINADDSKEIYFEWTPTTIPPYCIMVTSFCDHDPILWETEPTWDTNIGIRNTETITMYKDIENNRWIEEFVDKVTNYGTQNKNFILNLYSSYIPNDWDISVEVDDTIYDLITGHLEIPIHNVQVDETIEIKYVSTAPLDTYHYSSTIESWIFDEGRLIGGATREFKTDVNPPNKPEAPLGVVNGKINTEYVYTTSTTDPEEDQISYLFDWGDGTDSGWTDPISSGNEVRESHSWLEEGDYEIKVKARDIPNFAESEWSDPLSISMPRNKPFTDRSFLKFLQNIMERFPLFARLLRL